MENDNELCWQKFWLGESVSKVGEREKNLHTDGNAVRNLGQTYGCTSGVDVLTGRAFMGGARWRKSTSLTLCQQPCSRIAFNLFNIKICHVGYRVE